MCELFCVVICWQPWWHIASFCLLRIAFGLTRGERTYRHLKQRLKSLITLKEALKKECLCLFLMLQDSVFVCINCFIIIHLNLSSIFVAGQKKSETSRAEAGALQCSHCSVRERGEGRARLPVWWRTWCAYRSTQHLYWLVSFLPAPFFIE